MIECNFIENDSTDLVLIPILRDQTEKWGARKGRTLTDSASMFKLSLLT